MHVVAAGSAFDLPLPDWDFRAIDAALWRGFAAILLGIKALAFAAVVWAVVAGLAFV